MSDAEVAGILDLALESGVTHIDTAAVYGDALQRLRPWSSAFTFTGKIVGTDPVDPVDQVSSSLNVLGCEKFDACLVREWDQLGEAQRDDANFAHIAAWEFNEHGDPIRHEEPLQFTALQPSTRSYR